jgi:hypothetical protein
MADKQEKAANEGAYINGSLEKKVTARNLG